MQKTPLSFFRGRGKFILGGLLILAAVIYLIFTSTQANAEYFMTVNEIKAKGNSFVGQNLRLSGAVVGNSIKYDPQTMLLSFDIAHVPGDNASVEAGGGLAAVLHSAVSDPTRARITVTYSGPKPDMLRDEAQAIVTGRMAADGIFHADELLLKCPTKYQEAVPSQVTGGN
jgi:cytochrome c-type biogenesis protein CcmE